MRQSETKRASLYICTWILRRVSYFWIQTTSLGLISAFSSLPLFGNHSVSKHPSLTSIHTSLLKTCEETSSVRVPRVLKVGHRFLCDNMKLARQHERNCKSFPTSALPHIMKRCRPEHSIAVQENFIIQFKPEDSTANLRTGTIDAPGNDHCRILYTTSVLSVSSIAPLEPAAP